MDDSELFMQKKELGIETNILSLTSENITAERKFKIAVMEWLSNGQAKIFRTPAEGNFVVYLMNISLSPENGLGRMLHSFSCNAVEIGNFDLKTLAEYELIDAAEELIPQTRWKTIDLYPLTEDKTSTEMIKLNTQDIYSVTFTNMMPGSIVQVGNEKIQIGATGTYSFESKNPITYIGVQKNATIQGMCTYSYHSTTVNVFNNIRHVEIIDVPIRQIIGDQYKTIAFPGYNPEKEPTYTSDNILDIIQDSKNEVLAINFARFYKRPLIDVYIPPDFIASLVPGTVFSYPLYEDMDCLNIVQGMEDMYIYPIRLARGDYRERLNNGELRPYLHEGYYVTAMSTNFAPYTNYAIDGLTGLIVEINNDFFKVKVNDENIELNEIEQHYIEGVDTITSIVNNPGVLTELSYCKQLKTFAFEVDNPEVKALKEVYEEAHSQYNEDRNDLSETLDLNTVLTPYNAFITELNKTIINYKKDNGLEI